MLAAMRMYHQVQSAIMEKHDGLAHLYALFSDDSERPAGLQSGMDIWFDSFGNLLQSWEDHDYVMYCFPARLSHKGYKKADSVVFAPPTCKCNAFSGQVSGHDWGLLMTVKNNILLVWSRPWMRMSQQLC